MGLNKEQIQPFLRPAAMTPVQCAVPSPDMATFSQETPHAH